MNITGISTTARLLKIFRAGCIIRAQFLQITDAYAKNAGIANLLLAPYFKIADEYQQALRDVVTRGAERHSGATDILCGSGLL